MTGYCVDRILQYYYVLIITFRLTKLNFNVVGVWVAPSAASFSQATWCVDFSVNLFKVALNENYCTQHTL